MFKCSANSFYHSTFQLDLQNKTWDMIETIKRVIEQEAKAIRSIPISEGFNIAIELIHKNVHQKKGKIVTSGMGKAGQIALNIATTFSSTGTPSVFLHPSESQHGDLGIIQENDLTINGSPGYRF